jgi:hypothetical protein
LPSSSITVGLTGYDIDVTAIATPVTLVNAALDATTLHPGTPAEGFILGVMPGATLAATGVPSGMTLDLKRRYWRWDGTGSVSTPTIQFTQTLSTATNSGLVNNVGITISARSLTCHSV